MIRNLLKKYYILLASPGGVLLFIYFVLYALNRNFFITKVGRIGSTIFLFVGLIFAFLVPLWYKLFFIKKIKDGKVFSKESFLRFEKNYLSISFIAVYNMLFAYLFQVDRIPMYIIILSGIYVLYYYYPSERRIALEKRIFKIEE